MKVPRRVIYVIALIGFLFFFGSNVSISALGLEELDTETLSDNKFVTDSNSIDSDNELSNKEDNWSPEIGPTVFDKARDVLLEVKPPVKYQEMVGFYAEDWSGDNRSLNAVQKYGQNMTAIAPFAYVLNSDGSLTGNISEVALDTARKKNLKVFVLVHNYRNNNFDRATLSNVLNNRGARQKLINNIYKIIVDKQLAGVNIDLENLNPKDRNQFNIFLSELKANLEKDGYLLTISVPAKTRDDSQNAWSGGYDYKAIGSLVDRVMLMTYDEHWFGGTPGPVASLPWVEQVLSYAVSEIPKEKLLLGIGIYGYDWSFSHNKTRALSSIQVQQLVREFKPKIEWDNKAQVPYFYYWKNEDKRVVWFESDKSAALKADLVPKYGLRGVAVWRLGFEDEEFWETIIKQLVSKN